jgi:hypothetical protein
VFPSTFSFFLYTVRPFDTFWSLASQFDTSVEALIAANPGVDPNNLFIGQMIRIPQHPSTPEFEATDTTTPPMQPMMPIMPTQPFPPLQPMMPMQPTQPMMQPTMPMQPLMQTAQPMAPMSTVQPMPPMQQQIPMAQSMMPLQTAVPQHQTNRCMSRSEHEFRSFHRLLWEQHVSWTRMAIISLVFKLPDVDEVLTRLLRNATDMGNMMKRFYGEQVGTRYAALVREHLVIAKDLAAAAITGNQQEVAAQDRKWHANGDEISDFLSSINPFLSKEEVRKMWYTQLNQTATEAVSMIKKDFKTDVAIFDDIEANVLLMGDAISDAIIKQFPGMFR